MSRGKISKINQVLIKWPHGTIVGYAWFEKNGINRKLVERYLQSGWLESIGRGAFKRPGDEVDWMGGLFALQNSFDRDVHVGGKTALGLQGYAHFIPLGTGYSIYLFGNPSVKLPTWFQNSDWKVNVIYRTTNLFQPIEATGLTNYKRELFDIVISSAERAIFEVLLNVNSKESYEDALLLFESLTTLRPQLVTQLLDNCNSIKAKRLFMVMSEYNNHKWLDRINLTNVDFGKGKRTISKGGTLNQKYQIVIPEKREYDEPF